MKPLQFVRLLLITTTLLLLFAKIPLQAQVTLSATGSGTAYGVIDSKGFGNENPDCKHPSFGAHVTQAFDNTLGKYVFVFHSHADADDDRCTNEDRVRMEIKGGSGSPADMQHTQGQTAYYRWKFKLDAGFIPSNRFTHIFQIKAIEGDAGAPLITITPRAGNPQKMQIIHSSGEGSGSLGTVKEVDLAPFKGNWVEAYVKYKSSDGSAGTFEITLRRVSDGVVLLSYSNNSIDMWREGADYNRGKWGVYRGKHDVLRDEQVRFNDFCITESNAGLCPGGAGGNPGGTTNLNAQHDAYVRDGTNASTAFGSTDAAVLVTKVAPAGQANNNRESYFIFDLSSVTGTITGATLKVNGHTEDSRDANIVVGAYAVSNTTWTESTITWNNKPASASAALATAMVTDATARYYNWNVTSYIQNEKAAGRTKVSFVLKNQQETQGRLLWNSKETGSNAPQLTITTAAAARQETNVITIPTTTTGELNSFPNPFRENSIITFTLDKPAHTNLSVYDITGKQVAVLINGMLQTGNHKTLFNADRLSAGIYTLKLTHNGKTIIRKMLKE
jgi:hypothetical protein